jgi:hypothetical protein
MDKFASSSVVDGLAKVTIVENVASLEPDPVEKMLDCNPRSSAAN